MHEARGVEQDVDLADTPGHFAATRLGVARIEPRHFGHAFPGQQRQFGLVDIGCKHRGALARKGQRAGAADAHGRRGHECAFAFQAV